MPLYTFKCETMCAQVSASMSSTGSSYSWPPRPATFSIQRRRLGRCQGYLPVKIGQIMGWPRAPVSLMWLVMLAHKYMHTTTQRHMHTQLNRHAEVDACTHTGAYMYVIWQMCTFALHIKLACIYCSVWSLCRCISWFNKRGMRNTMYACICVWMCLTSCRC